MKASIWSQELGSKYFWTWRNVLEWGDSSLPFDFAQGRLFRMTGRAFRMTDLMFRSTASKPAQQPVGYVDVGGEVFGASVALEDVGDRDVEVGDGGELALPFREAVHIGKGGELPAPEHGKFLRRDLRLPSGGEPEELSDESGADYGGNLWRGLVSWSV